MLELPVSSRSLAVLAKQLELDPGPNYWWIVDAPGIEASVLAGLEDPDLRRFFGHVVLRSARSGPRDNSTDIEHLAKAFRRREYAMLGDVDFSDGDWPRLHLQYVSHTARQKELGAELRTIQERARELLADKDALKERLREQNLDFQDRTSKLEVALRELTQDSESRVDSLQGELARVTKALKGQAFELSAAAEAFERHRQKLETELERTRDDLAVALRLQALRDADLKELQNRYAEIKQVRDRQLELLVQLGQRLKSASEYLKALESGEDPAGGSVPTASLARVLSGELESTR